MSSFGKRQFGPHQTSGQISFDVAFGIALPLFCLALYPAVVRSVGLPDPVKYPIGGLIAIGISMISLAIWLVSRCPPSLLAGLLLASACLASWIGAVMLPLSVLGLMVTPFAVLGFVPCLTAFVYSRNAWRAYLRSLGGPPFLATMAISLLLYVAVPYAAHTYVANNVSQATEMLLSDDPVQSAKGITILKRFGWMADLSLLVFRFDAERDQSRRKLIADVYRELTGEEITVRLAVFND